MEMLPQRPTSRSELRQEHVAVPSLLALLVLASLELSSLPLCVSSSASEDWPTLRLKKREPYLPAIRGIRRRLELFGPLFIELAAGDGARLSVASLNRMAAGRAVGSVWGRLRIFSASRALCNSAHSVETGAGAVM